MYLGLAEESSDVWISVVTIVAAIVFGVGVWISRRRDEVRAKQEIREANRKQRSGRHPRI
jgi:hypothetical protein